MGRGGNEERTKGPNECGERSLCLVGVSLGDQLEAWTQSVSRFVRWSRAKAAKRQPDGGR